MGYSRTRLIHSGPLMASIVRDFDEYIRENLTKRGSKFFVNEVAEVSNFPVDNALRTQMQGQTLPPLLELIEEYCEGQWSFELEPSGYYSFNQMGPVPSVTWNYTFELEHDAILFCGMLESLDADQKIGRS